MRTQIRMWVAVAVISLGATTVRAQAQLPVLPAATTTSATVAAVAPELLRPTEVSGKYKDYLAQRYAADVEAQAIIKHYAHRQTGGALWLAAGVGAISFVASQTGTTTSSSGTRTVNVSPLGYGILVGIFGGVGVGKLARFSNQKLFEALMAHDQRVGLPGRPVSSLLPATRE